MKIEEVIEILENPLVHTTEEVREARWMAIFALRSMPKAGEPLSLEQLREMDGKPVWIEDKEYPENTGWVIWDDSFKQNWLGDPETRNSHGKSWFAYSYPPARIDRRKWAAEWRELHGDKMVGINDVGEDVYRHYHYCVCKSCGKGSAVKTNFCPHCGKAMTEEAWAELERRLRG